MSDVMIQATDFSKEQVKSILNAAYIQYHLDSDGDLVVHEGNYKILVMPVTEKCFVQFVAFFGSDPAVPMLKKLEAVNKVNEEVVAVSAYVGETGRVIFEETIFTDAGITPQQFVFALRRFSRILEVATNEMNGVLV